MLPKSTMISMVGGSDIGPHNPLWGLLAGYNKQIVTVHDGVGQELSALVYVMDEKLRDLTMPHLGYYDIILQGYCQSGLLEAALKKVLNHAVREV